MRGKIKDIHEKIKGQVQYLKRASQYFLAYSLQVPNLLGKSASICMKSFTERNVSDKLPSRLILFRNNSHLLHIYCVKVIFSSCTIHENYEIACSVLLILPPPPKKNQKHRMLNTSSGLPRAGVPVRRIALVAFCTIGNKMLLRIAFLDFI